MQPVLVMMRKCEKAKKCLIDHTWLDSCAENDGDDEALKNLSLGAAQATIKEEAQQESVLLNANASPDSTTSHSNANASVLTSSNDVPNPYQPQNVTKLPPFHNRIRHSIWLKTKILFRSEKRLTCFWHTRHLLGKMVCTFFVVTIH